MATENTGTAWTTPDEYNKAIAEARAPLLAEQAEMEMASQAMLDAAINKPKFIPGTAETKLSLTTKKLGQLQAEQTAQKIASEANWEQMMVDISQNLQELYPKQKELAKQLAVEKSVSIFSDPFTALKNAFTAPWTAQALEGVEGQIAAAKKASDVANSHVQQSALTADRIKTSVTAESIADVAEAAQALAVEEAMKAKIELSKLKVGNLKEVLTMSNMQLQAYSAYRAESERAERMQMARESAARQNKLFDMQLEKFKDEEQKETIQMGLANEALTKEGRAPLTGEGFRTLKAGSAKLFDELVRRGLDLRIKQKHKVPGLPVTPDEYSHGDTVFKRKQIRDLFSFTPDTEQQKTIIEMQDAAITSALAGANAAAMAEQGGKKPDVKTAAINADAIFETNFKAGQKNIKEGSPFMAPAYDVFEKKVPAVANDPIWKKYISPLITDANRMSPVNAAIVLQAVSAGVMNRELTSAQAAQFTANLFKRAVEINNETHQFKKIANHTQIAYGVTIDTGSLTEIGGLLSVPEKINMLDPVQVSKAMTKIALNKIGLKLNMSGGYAPDQHKDDIYPPLFERGLVR